MLSQDQVEITLKTGILIVPASYTVIAVTHTANADYAGIIQADDYPLAKFVYMSELPLIALTPKQEDEILATCAGIVPQIREVYDLDAGITDPLERMARRKLHLMPVHDVETKKELFMHTGIIRRYKK